MTCPNYFRDFHHHIIIQNERPIIQYLTTYLVTEVYRFQGMSRHSLLIAVAESSIFGVLRSPITVFASRWPLVSRIKSRLCGFLELLEPSRQPVSIGTILKPSWSVDQCSGDPFRRF